RVAGELPRVGERAARVVRLLRPDLQVEVVAAEPHAMPPAVHGEAVVELEVLVVPEDERGGISHRAVETARRNLRIADVTVIARHAEQADLAGEVDAAVHADLAAVDPHPAESDLVQHRP